MDKYDKAIKYLTENPNQIHEAWNCHVQDEKGGQLFKFATMKDEDLDTECGCITQIRSDDYESGFGNLVTEQIRGDSRIPRDEFDIRVEDLPVFAEWQRKFDVMRSHRRGK